MKPIVADIISIQTKNPLSGKDLIVERTIKGEKMSVKQAIVNCKYGQFWLPAENVGEDHNQLNLTMHEVGDTFEAARDSRRTKGEVMGKDCPAGKEDEPLYFKGDVVPRTNVSYVPTGTQKAIIAKEEVLSFEQKIAVMAKYGLTPKM